MICEPNVIITLEDFDELEESYSSVLFPGLAKESYYEISSYNPKYTYGYCSTQNFFKALKKVIQKNNYKSNKEREYLNHWRWFPRKIWYAKDDKVHAEGGHIVHYYTSRDLVKCEDFRGDFTLLSEMNQNTQYQWNKLNSEIIKSPFSRGGNPLKKMGLGKNNIEDLWWCDNDNQSVGFSKMDLKKLILEI
jgi:hypothetical protein